MDPISRISSKRTRCSGSSKIEGSSNLQISARVPLLIRTEHRKRSVFFCNASRPLESRIRMPAPSPREKHTKWDDTGWSDGAFGAAERMAKKHRGGILGGGLAGMAAAQK